MGTQTYAGKLSPAMITHKSKLPLGAQSFPKVGKGLGGLPIREDNSNENKDFLAYYYATDKTNKNVTINVIDIKSGNIFKSVIFDLFSYTATSVTYYVVDIAANGNTMIIAEISTSVSYIHVFDISNGIDKYSYLYTHTISEVISSVRISISPNGKRATYYTPSVMFYILNLETNTIIKTYAYGTIGAYGPAGGIYTPSGSISCFASSDESASIVENTPTSFSTYNRQWTGWNQGYYAFNYNGTKNFYGGSSVNLNYHEYTYVFAPNSTTLSTIYLDFNPIDCNPNEGNDGLPYLIGNLNASDGDHYSTTGIAVIDYLTSTIVHQILDTTLGALYFLKNGDIVLYNSTTMLRSVIRPSALFADVTSEYSQNGLLRAGKNNRFSLPNTPQLYSSI